MFTMPYTFKISRFARNDKWKRLFTSSLFLDNENSLELKENWNE